jgi:hypothetical protein
VEVFAQPLENRLTLAFGNLSLDFVKGEVNDVVVVEILPGQGLAKIEPHFVQQIDFLRGQARRVRPEIKDLLLARWGENLERNSRPRFLHSLPRKTDFVCLLGNRRI